MRQIFCNVCGLHWDGNKYCGCPYCLEQQLLSKDIITPKHDPNEPVIRSNHFSSKLSYEFINDIQQFVHNVVFEGTLYFNNRYKTYELFVRTGIGYIGGSAIPPNSSFPIERLDGVKIADVYGDAHAYPECTLKYEDDISAGVVELVNICATEGCINYCSPNSIHCREHKKAE